jgi:hypothetical protein
MKDFEKDLIDMGQKIGPRTIFRIAVERGEVKIV